MRKRVQVYGNGKSKSARVLAKALGINRLKVKGSKFVPKTTDVILNWGMPQNELQGVKYLNPIDSIRIASNKLKTLITLQEKGISIPKYCTDVLDLDMEHKYYARGGTYYARHTLSGHSGRGIEVFNVGECETIPDAPLYVEAIDKKYEYRVIVVNGVACDVKAKKKKNFWTGDRDENVWNHSNGYVFARNVGTFPCNLKQLGVDSVEALGLHYGAVDIIEDNEGVLYVLEVNTAFGIDGSTIDLVLPHFKELLYEN